MPWSGSGTYSRIYGASGWTDDKNAGTKILSSRHDTHDQDIADGINACTTRDNQAKPTASFLPATDNTINLGSGSFRWASINGVTFSDFARQSQQNTFTVTSGSNTQAIAFSAAGTANFAQLLLRNDVSHVFAAGISSSTYSGAIVVGGPTGESTFVGSASSLPLSIITNSSERIRIAADGSTINLAAGAVQVNGVPFNTYAATKAASTSRNTTTTFASDPDLALTSVPAGTYEVEVVLFFDCTAAASGFKAQLSLSGTVANGVLAPFGANGSNTSNFLGYQSYAAGVINVMTFSSAFATATQNWIVARGSVTLSTTQNVALQWAQQTSSASAALLQVMSRLTLRRIA
jgi:hypothetical protein